MIVENNPVLTLPQQAEAYKHIKEFFGLTAKQRDMLDELEELPAILIHAHMSRNLGQGNRLGIVKECLRRNGVITY